MSKDQNAAKAAALGMPFGTASAKLRKSLLFQFAQRLMLDTCYQCKDKIDDIDEFSIEHTTPWFNSKDPVGMFFNLDNIAFSHISCNVAAAKRPNKIYSDAREKSRESFKRYYADPVKKDAFLARKRAAYHAPSGRSGTSA